MHAQGPDLEDGLTETAESNQQVINEVNYGETRDAVADCFLNEGSTAMEEEEQAVHAA